MPAVRLRPRLGFSAVLTVVALVARPSHAEDLEGVSWEAPASCPSEADVRDAVRQWLPDAPVDLGAIRVVARVKPHAAGFALELSFESKSGSGHETLVAARCQTLADVVALKVALAADPDATLESTEPEPEQPRRNRRSALARTQYGIRLAGGVGFGPLPGAGPAVSLVGSVIWQNARLELGAGYWFPKTAHFVELPSVGADLSLAAAILRACATPRLGSVELPACGGLEIGNMRGTGFGVDTIRTADRLWIAVVLGPRVGIPLSDWLVLWLEGDAVLALVRPDGYGIRNLGTLYQPGIGAARAWAGLEVRFR
jgi:hypothetical protein